MKEYQSTGESPDYFQTRLRLDCFYHKITQSYADQVDGKLPKDSKAPPLNVIVDVVKNGLLHDPPLFTPEESVVAQHFMDSMKDLKVEPESVAHYMRDLKSQEKHPETPEFKAAPVSPR